MRRLFACLICMGFALSGSSRAAAQPEASSFDQTGVYVAAGAVFLMTTQIENALEDELDSLGLSGIDADHDMVYGYKVRAGWRYHAAAAVEAEFERGPESEISLEGLHSIDINSWIAMINLKFYPMGGRFQPYALFGGGLMNVGIGTTPSASESPVPTATSWCASAPGSTPTPARRSSSSSMRATCCPPASCASTTTPPSARASATAGSTSALPARRRGGRVG